MVGDEIITALGKGLDNVTSGVKIGDNEVKVISSNGTHLVFKSPAMKPGRYAFNLITK